jgi:rod shape-determining protein MreC
MHQIISRHRPLSLLAAVVLAQVLLLAFQIKRDHNIRLLRLWAAQGTTPFESTGSWFFSKIGGLWTGYVALHGARVENRLLHKQIDELELRNRELATRAAEADRLAVLLNLHEAHPEAPMIAAQVIGASADPASHTVFINRGERDRVRRNQAVITADGIVGKIVEVFPTTSQVLLINDKDSGVGALFVDTRTHGVVKGYGDPDPRMEYVINDEKVHPGEAVLTSGEDRIFPKGLMVGTVRDVKPGYPFQIIHVQPGARLDRLEDVMILLTQQELAPESARGFAVAPVETQPAAQPDAGSGAQTQGAAAPAKPSTSSKAAAKSAKPAAPPAQGAKPPASNRPAGEQ